MGSEFHWIKVAVALPTVHVEGNVLVVLRKNVKPGHPEYDERWMDWATFDHGVGWAGSYMDNFSDDMIVTHWAPRPEFPLDPNF